MTRLKSRLNDLLAQCYDHLGDSDRKRDAYQRAIAANPQDLTAQLGLATSMVLRGELDQAIGEYRKLVDQVPQARSSLVRLLIVRNQQRSPAQRDWTEVARLIKGAKDFAPNSSEWVLLQADLLLVQDKTTEAETLLAEARARSPRDLELWVKSSEVLRRQRKYSEAGALLDQAEKTGDTVGLRLERMQLLVAQGGIDLSRAFGALAANTRSFSPADRHLLLETLAAEITRVGDLPLAQKLLLEVVDLDPNNLEPRLLLLDLAFQAKDKDVIETRLQEIKEIDGADGPTGRYQEIRYALWQAEHSTDRDEQRILRSSARLKINELSSRRPDWPQIPLALASLDDQELAQPGLDEATRKDKVNEAANHYLRAIELGQRSLPIIRRATDLLYEAGRRSEVTQLWNQLPTATLLGSNLQQQVTREALRNRDFERAIDLARKAIAANPDDFRERYWLVLVLLASQHPDCQAEAEAELRGAVNAVGSDPDRWTALVVFLAAQTKQMEKAEQALRDAEAELKEKSPVTLARCCEVVGQAYKLAGQDTQKTRIWYEAAAQWYRAAQNAKPDDPAATHLLVEFLIRSRQLKEAESELEVILNRNHAGDPKSVDEVAWARRTLAWTLLMNGNDYHKTSRALAILEPIVKAARKQGAADGTAIKPDDLRVLALVYRAQGTKVYQEKAREILEELADAHAIIPQDRFLLAQIYTQDGEWTKARQQYRKLLEQTEITQDPEIIMESPQIPCAIHLGPSQSSRDEP